MLEKSDLKVVNVNTHKGRKPIIFKRVEVNPSFLEGSPARCSDCAYSFMACSHISDPRENRSIDSNLEDFCREVNENIAYGDGSKVYFYIPVPESFESNLADVSLSYYFYKSVRRQGYVRLSRVIETVCKGVCSQYNDLHSNCKLGNKLCIIHDLLKK